MAAVVTGVGLGLERSSANLLGANGLIGSPVVGEGGDQVYVNAANGNLIDTRTDQILTGIGPDDVISETYNSLGSYGSTLGTYSSANGPGGWIGGYQTVVGGLTGTVGTSGSTITRIAPDGSNVIYAYQSGYTYIANEGGGAWDTLTFNTGNSQWTWTDGASQETMTYDGANGGRLMSVKSADGAAVTYNYSGSQLSSIDTTDNSGSQESTNFAYTGGQISSISTSYYSGGSAETLTQEYYAYDTSGRLSTVTIDLSPTDNATSDGNTFVTTYGYQGSSNLISSITGSDGSSLTIAYMTDGSNRVSSFTQMVASGVTRTTSFSYGSGVTTVTDPLNISTTLAYDTSGDLTTKTVDPSGADVVTKATYDGAQGVGDVTSQTVGGVTTYYYYSSSTGVRTQETDGAGNVTNWTYGAASNDTDQLLTTTQTPVSGTTETSYDIYGATGTYGYNDDLAFTVTQQGVVTQYVYGAGVGEVSSVISYTNDAFNTSGYSSSSPPTLSNLTSWVAGLSDLQNTQRTDTLYDLRGNVAQVTTYGADTTSGSGASSTTENSVTAYTYDTAGRLTNTTAQALSSAYSYEGLQRLPTNPAGASTVYDGLGRTVEATNEAGETSFMAYSLTSDSSYAINPAGTVTLTTRDDAGEVTSTTVYATQLSSGQLSTLGTLVNKYNYYSTIAGEVTPSSGSDETTSYKYDADGRLMMVTDAKGNSTYYLYDTDGRKTADIDALGDMTEYRYTSASQVDETIQYATPLTTGQLSTLGLASVSSPVVVSTVRPSSTGADRYAWSVYDADHRVIETIDGLGSVTAYTYDGVSNLLATTEYATQLTSTQLSTFQSTPPTTEVLPSTSSSDRTTRNFYDGDNRLIGTLDPNGYLTEIYYDDAGQKTRTVAFATQASSSLWASGTFSALLSNVAPSGPTSSDDNTWYVYDARGLLRGKVDGDGDVTQYHYDPLGQVDQTITGQQLTVSTLLTTPPTLSTLTGLSTSGDDVTDLTLNLLGEVATTRNNVVTTPSTNTYDILGNLTETQDANGDKTFFYYDSFNRKIAEVNALGALTTWTYDLDNAVTSETTYGVAVSIPTSAGGTPPSPTDANNYRRTSYTYDADERVTVTTVTAGSEDPIEIGSVSGATITPSTSSGLTSTTYYDAFGDVWKSVDANGNATYAFYNAVGQKIASVDGDRYLTGYSLDAFWDVASQTAYATALSSGTVSGFTAVTDNTEPTPTTNASVDRTTTYVYDTDGNVKSQSVGNVAVSTISGLTVTTTTGGASTIKYTYNALGEKFTETQATGDTTSYTYTGAGRLASVTSPSFTDAGGGTDTAVSVYSYNGLGEVSSIASGQSGSPTRTTSYGYDAIGRKTSLTDASGFTQYYAYDNDGNVVTASYVRLNSSDSQHTTTVNGNTVSEEITYTYNAANQQLTQATADWNSSAWVSGDPTSTTYDTANLQYDLYGEVTGKGINGLYQEIMTYDGAGRMVESDAAGGAPTYDLYDGDGHVTATLASAGTSFYTSGTLDTLAQVLAPGSTYGGSYVSGIELTLTTYDAKGQATSVIQPFQQINSSTPSSSNTYTSTVAYDAFGDAVSTTNALGATTTNTYDGLGELTQSVAPSVTLYSASSPTGYSAAPTTSSFYDISGRQIATEDANGHYTTQTLLAGTGYGGSQADVVEQWLPDATSISYGYDVFGDQTKITDQLGRVTTKTYDGMGRLLTQTLPADTTNSDAALIDFYAYDGLGQRIAQTNSALNTGVSVSGYYSGQLADSTGAKQTTDYDSQGRIVATEDEMRTYETTYDYSWSGTQTTTGMGPGGGTATATFGAWTETQKQFQLVNTTNDLGYTTDGSTTSAIRTETTLTDFFGHQVGQTDFGGNTYAYTYNPAGQLAAQTNSLGQTLAYAYFNTGQTYTITSGPSGSQMVTTYGYDALGEKLTETQVKGSTYYEDETATYDAVGWTNSIVDTNGASTTLMSVSYGYDANGNVVTTTSEYETLGGNGTGSAAATSPVTYWNSYDQMNRQLVAQGTLISGTVTRGETGTDIMYDAAGERVAASTMTESCVSNTWYDDVHTEWYGYTADGYLSTVQIANTTVADPSLPLSVGIDDSAAPQSGAYTAESNVYNSQGQQTSETQYNAAGTAVYIRSSIAYDTDGQVTFDYLEQVINGTDHQYQDEYFYDASPTSTITGVYEGGQLTNVSTDQRTGGHAYVYGSAYTYAWTTQALQSVISYNNGSGSSTDLYYDGNNDLTTVSIGGSPSSTVSYVYNADGEVLDHTASGGTTIAAAYFYLSGHEVGSVGDTGSDQANYATTIANEATPPSGPPSAASADIGNTYTALGGQAPAPDAGSYTVQAGDTLQSIAQAQYGDASLWYLIAGANGLSAGAPLAAGQTLSLPNDVINAGNNASTFKPYNSSQATGQVQPNPNSNHGSGGCGGVGTILAAIVAVAVAVILEQPELLANLFAAPGAALGASVGGALGSGAAAVGTSVGAAIGGGLSAAAIGEGLVIGAVSGLASQAVLLATGAERSFNWSAVALSAIGAGVSGGLANGPLQGLDSALPGGQGGFLADAANGAIGNVVTQGIGVATGLQNSFDWTSIATSGIEAGVNATQQNPYLGSAAALLAGATARTILTGETFGQSLLQEAPNTIATALGDALGGTIDGLLNATAEKASAGPAGDFEKAGAAGGPLVSLPGPEDYGAIERESGGPAAVGEYTTIAPNAAILSNPLIVAAEQTAIGDSNFADPNNLNRREAGFQAWQFPDGTIHIITGESYPDYPNGPSSNFQIFRSDVVAALGGDPDASIPDGSTLLVDFHTHPFTSQPGWSADPVPSQWDVNHLWASATGAPMQNGSTQAYLDFLSGNTEPGIYNKGNVIGIVAAPGDDPTQVAKFYYYGPGAAGTVWHGPPAAAPEIVPPAAPPAMAPTIQFRGR